MRTSCSPPRPLPLTPSAVLLPALASRSLLFLCLTAWVYNGLAHYWASLHWRSCLSPLHSTTTARGSADGVRSRLRNLCRKRRTLHHRLRRQERMRFEEKVTYELGYAFGKSNPYVKHI